MKTTVKEEMFYTGGGCWLVERTVKADGNVWYARYDGDGFAVSKVSIEAVWNDTAEDESVYYWEMITEDDYKINEMFEAGWYKVYVEMRTAWSDADKTLKRQ